MDLIFPDNGGVYWLQYGVSNGVKYHLRTNSFVIGLTDTISDYDECSLPGYAAITVTAGDFTLTGVTEHLATVQAAPISFTCTSESVTVYGYYITDTSDTYLLGSATFDTSQTLSEGSPIYVNPIIGQTSELST